MQICPIFAGPVTFLDFSSILDGLRKNELPLYFTKATDVSPCWSAAAIKVLLVQPSFAAAEWVFLF